MYSKLAIKVRINKTKYEYFHGDRTKLGCHKIDGELSYRNWGGFTGQTKHPVKINAEGFTYDHPNWVELAPDEALLGSWDRGWVYVVLPFTPVKIKRC